MQQRDARSFSQRKAELYTRHRVEGQNLIDLMEQLIDTGAGKRRNRDGRSIDATADFPPGLGLTRGQPVRFVEDKKLGNAPSADFSQNLQHVCRVLSGMRRRDVDNMQN